MCTFQIKPRILPALKREIFHYFLCWGLCAELWLCHQTLCRDKCDYIWGFCRIPVCESDLKDHTATSVAAWGLCFLCAGWISPTVWYPTCRQCFSLSSSSWIAALIFACVYCMCILLVLCLGWKPHSFETLSCRGLIFLKSQNLTFCPREKASRWSLLSCMGGGEGVYIYRGLCNNSQACLQEVCSYMRNSI